MDAPGHVGRAHARYVGGHVRDYKVDPAAFERCLQALQSAFFPEIPPDERHPGQRRDLQQVERDDLPRPPHALRKHLRPASRRSAQIHRRVARAREPLPVYDVEQLERRARAVALRARLADVRVAHVAPQPRAAGFASGHSLDLPNVRIPRSERIRRAMNYSYRTSSTSYFLT